MANQIRVLIIVGIATFCLAPVAYAATGTATFYTPPYVPSSCNGYQNDGVMIAAASDAIWNNRAACGRMYSVRCTGPTNKGVPQPCTGQSVVVKVVDYCPPGCAGTIDLSQEAFSVIANRDAGKINIEFNQFIPNNTGTATFYTPPYVPSSCNGYQDDGVMIAAASDAIWDNRAACGRMYSVRCTGPTNQGVPQPCTGQSVVVKIVDYCPPGCAGTIDLSQEAFSVIANRDAGKINIEYNQIRTRLVLVCEENYNQ